MSNRAWMPLYIADYLADTGHLSAAEHGAYLLLIMHYWQNGGLPADERLIARIAKLSADQWAESRDILAMLFEDGWRHKRIDGELAKADEIISKRKSAAEDMHRKRRASAVHVHSNSSDTRVPPTPTPLKEEANASSKRARENDDFEAWYRHYPHKVQRGAAERAFSKALQLATLDELVAGTQRYVASKPPDYAWRNPATWLNGKGWLDAPAPVARANGPPPNRREQGNVVQANMARRIRRNEPDGGRLDNGDAELLPSDGTELRAVVGHLGAALNRPFGSGDH